ncbi:MAG: hypothetical protein U0Z53_01845 [Blastocatellia bacterium]
MEEYEIWIEAEEWESGELDPACDNTEVVVTFADGAKWEATFLTYANVAKLVEDNKGNGSFLSGRYFWTRDMILIDEISRESITEVIERMLETGDFFEAFGCYGEGHAC